MFDLLIQRVLATHPDFTYEEVQIFCQDFYDSITEKIKEETKIKRLTKYLEKEFELDREDMQKVDSGIYTLESIPSYLMSGKPEITSSLVTIIDLVKNIEQTELFDHVDLQINRNDKIALIGKNGAGKTTFLKTILGEIPAISGKISINPDLIIGSYSQVLSDLDTELSILAELSKDYPKENDIRSMLG